MRHISSAFEKDLNDLGGSLQKLGDLARKRFALAIDGIATQREDALSQVIDGDSELDDIEAFIHEKAFEIIALRAPSGQDLRYVLVSLKVATVLERIGDFSRNIAQRTRVISAAGNDKIPGVNIGRMGHLVETMLIDVMHAYADQDPHKALKVWRQDVEVDHMHTSFYKEVLASMSRDSDQVVSGVHLLFIAKNIERVGDYTTGIAEQIHFLVEGTVPDDSRPKADRSSDIVTSNI